MDHPRSRGVYRGTHPMRDQLSGSSPLARGLPSHKAFLAIPTWIIPARAGFTTGSAPSWATRPDHPRSRGVYASPRSPGSGTVGSSPLARGLREGSHMGKVLYGIIPARAGFTGACGSGVLDGGDHPRSRGVYYPLTSPHPPSTGSSPLARGLLTLIFGGRIAAVDHPRSRGVYRRRLLRPGRRSGSSPLARGLR